MLKFSIIIVSWNALGHLKKYLPSVVNTRYENFEIILADNASTDGSADWVGNRYPEIKIASLDRNYGYCGGNNRGAKLATGDILIFLNNDVEVDSNWLSELQKCFDSEWQPAVVQPKMCSWEDPESFEYAGAAGGFLDKYGYPFCRGRIFDTVESDNGQYDDRRRIFWASGAAFAIRKKIFDKFDGFDEDFEFHMEEIDLCWRILNGGYKITHCPSSTVYHLGGGSLPMGSPRKVYYNYRNNLTMLLKNYTTASLLLRFPIRLLLDLVSIFRMILLRDFKDIPAVIRAHLHFFLQLPNTIRKRSALQQRRKNSHEPAEMVNKSIIWEYFILNKKTWKNIMENP